MAERTQRSIIRAEHAPAAVGPYSQAVRIGDTLFCSGQIPLVPATGELVARDFRRQACQVLANLEAVLDAAGMGFENVVKVTVYLTDLANFPLLNELYAERFREPFPARVTVGVASLPKGALVEIDAIAIAFER